METKHKWSLYNNWKQQSLKSCEIDWFKIGWDFRTGYFSITLLNIDLTYAETYY